MSAVFALFDSRCCRVEADDEDEVFDPPLARCLADMCTRKPNTLGIYAESGGSGSGTKLLNVIRNKCGKVVPKAAPSTPAAPAPP